MDWASSTEALDSGSKAGRVKPKTIKTGIHSFPAWCSAIIKGQSEACAVYGRQVGRWQLDSKTERFFRCLLAKATWWIKCNYNCNYNWKKSSLIFQRFFAVTRIQLIWFGIFLEQVNRDSRWLDKSAYFRTRELQQLSQNYSYLHPVLKLKILHGGTLLQPWPNAFGMRKYFSEDYVIPSPKLNEHQKKGLRQKLKYFFAKIR